MTTAPAAPTSLELRVTAVEEILINLVIALDSCSQNFESQELADWLKLATHRMAETGSATESEIEAIRLLAKRVAG